MLTKILLLVAFIILFKIIYNFYYYILIKRYFKKYHEYIKDQKGWYIQGHRQNIIKIFQKANLKDIQISNVEPVGLGYVNTNPISLFANIAALREDIASGVVKYFMESQYVFRNRIIEAVNPFYWIESLIYLPKIILKYLGVGVDSIIIKVFQILWWAIVFASTIIGILFNKDFINWMNNLLVGK